MQAVPDLMPLSLESGIAEGAAGNPRVDPVAENPLIGLTKLPGPCKYSTTVDPDGKVKGESILQSEQFGASLGTTVERDRWLCGKLFGYSLVAKMWNPVAADRVKCPVPNLNTESGKWRYGINPAGAQE